MNTGHIKLQEAKLNIIIKMLMLGCLMGLCITTTMGCERHMNGDAPPLRPLVYTELPPSEEEEQPPEPEPIINIAPEDLGYGIFHALVDHDRTAYESIFITDKALSNLTRIPIDAAQHETKTIIKKSEILWTLFVPTLASEEPMGGLSARLRLSEFRLGKGRNLAGKIATPENDDLMQHWGNELRIELLGTDKIFTIRIPKIVKTPLGWRVAQAIEMDRTLQLFLETGMHLKSDLLTSEHYPMPLEVGNFWKYRVERGYDMGALPPAIDTVEPEQEVTTTDMITDISHQEGYWVVTFERTTIDPNKQDEPPEVKTFGWLVTPRMVFPCMRDCRNNAENISYLLGYMTHQTPMFIFPIEVGSKWSTAGQRETYAKYEVRSMHNEAVIVPDGAFIGAYEIFGSIEEGRESRFFVPGIGIVMRTVRSGVGQKREIMIKHRLIL